MKLSAIIKKYTASSENNGHQNNNRELSKTTMQNIHIWFNNHTTWQYCKQFTSNLKSIDLDNIFSSNQISILQKKKKNSWNIKMKPMMLETYSSRCRKLHMKLLTLPVVANITWNLYQMKCLFIKQISVEIYIRFNITLNLYQIWHKLQTYTR